MGPDCSLAQTSILSFFIEPAVTRFPVLSLLFWGQLLRISSQFFQIVVVGSSLGRHRSLAVGAFGSSVWGKHQ